MIDVLAGKKLESNCLDHGLVRLVDCMPRLSEDGTADSAIVQAARVSYGAGTKTVSDDTNLIRYLMRHRHTTPFEMVEFKFHCKMPIFIARQWIRHRTASVNEYSARYSEVPDLYYRPDEKNIKGQSKTNKQASDGDLDNDIKLYCQDAIDSVSKSSYDEYQELLARGVSREIARTVLPVNFYTEWYWKIDLKNLLDFLALRCDSHAQYEIRVFADAMLEIIRPIVPITIQAWEDYHPMRGGIMLSKVEQEALKKIFNIGVTHVSTFKGLSSREIDEFNKKLEKMIS